MARLRLLVVLFLGGILPALGQIPATQDPLLGGYILGNSAELVLVQPDATIGSLAGMLFDCTPGLGSPSTFLLSGSTALGDYSVDVAMADVDADGKEEAGFIHTANDGSLLFTLSRFTQGTVGLAYRTVTPLPLLRVRSGVRILRGCFDPDPNDEFLVAYWAEDLTLKLMVFDVDSTTLLPVMRGSIADVILASTLGGDARFDVAVGDCDRDGMDEVFLAKVNAATEYWETYPRTGNIRTHLSVCVYDYDPVGALFSKGGSVVIDVERSRRMDGFNTSLTEISDVRLGGLALTAGDFDNDGLDEPFVCWLSGMVLTAWSTFITSESYAEQLGQPLHVSEDRSSLWRDADDLISCELSIQQSTLFETLTSWGVWSLSAASADLNGNGSAEVVTTGFVNTSLFESDHLGKFTKRLSRAVNYPPFYLASASSRAVAIADLDADTSASRWIPEILVTSSGISPLSSYVYWDVLGVGVDPSTLAFTGFGRRAYGAIPTQSSGVNKWAVALGDADGDAIRVRNPRRIVQQSALQPLVVLNALPIHFDVLGGTPYDVCKSYNLNPGSFTAKYEEQSGVTAQFTTQVKSDWGLSTTLSGGGSFLGIGVKASLTSTYGESFTKKGQTSQTVTVTQSTTTRDDDRICVGITDYEFFEYPLFRRGMPCGNIMVVIPHQQNPPMRWVNGKSWEALWHTPRHEVGNILSYLPPGGAPGETDVDSLLHLFTPSEASQKSGMDWLINFEEFLSASEEQTNKIGFEAGLSVSGWGFELSVKGNYSRDELSTYTSTTTNGVRVTLHVDEIDKSIGEVEYTIGPCVYWARNGALVVDYTVSPARSSGGGLETWWESRYGHAPDPAFNLPWRLDPEKGYALTNPEKRWLSKSLRVSPPVAKEGERVTIKAKVFNFSLIPLTQPAVVRFFVGDPDSGGVPIVGDGGVTELQTIGSLEPRDYQNMQMAWTVPPGLGGVNRIYGVIDPDDSTSEIHEDNNRGFTEFTVLGATGVERSPANELPDRYALFQNYPNPFNPSTVIRYTLPAQALVSLRVYDVLGRELATLVEADQGPGIYNVWFDGSRYATGMYIYRLEAGTFSESRKLLLIK